jgi:accessory secretory protein Asp2
MTAGSSKGGFAALYFAYKCGYGATVAGAPQFLLGDYLGVENHIAILKSICGKAEERDKQFLNELLSDCIREAEYIPNTWIHVSRNEHHYQDHVLPLESLLNELDIVYHLDLADYSDHSQAGIYFPKFLIQTIRQWIAVRMD